MKLVRKALSRVFASTVLLGGIGCGGDLCDASLSDVAGTWIFTVEDDEIIIDISEDGTVKVSGEAKANCDVESDELCNLSVVCTDEDGDEEFSFSLRRAD